MKVVFHYDASLSLKTKLESLSDKGLEVTVVSASDSDGFDAAMGDCEVLWHVLTPVTATHIRNAPKLKLIQKIGVGVNTIDLESAKRNGVAVSNMPGTNSRAVAEMTLMLMLSALRKASFFDRQTRAGRGWDFDQELQDQLGEISGKTIGLVGFGEIPRLLTPILRAMGARVLYTATKKKNTPEAEWRHLDDLLKEADILSLHIPLTRETENLINAAAFQKMKPGAVLVNTARGGVVEQQALVDALTSGQLSAAGLDVFSEEPVTNDNPLLKLDNVTLAPHIAWLTTETLDRSIAIAVENCLRLKNGRDLLHHIC
jgi:phosphoglycerate dehydrogenase-like enzyme